MNGVHAQDARPESDHRVVPDRAHRRAPRALPCPGVELGAIAVVALASLTAATAQASAEAKLHATFVGDSVSASIGYLPAA